MGSLVDEAQLGFHSAVATNQGILSLGNGLNGSGLDGGDSLSGGTNVSPTANLQAALANGDTLPSLGA